jgi:hypothetical protein
MTILKNAPGIACFLLLFSPWGSLGLGRELHENYTPTQIHQRFCHHYASMQVSPVWVPVMYVQSILNPSALTCIPSQLNLEISNRILISFFSTIPIEVLLTTDELKTLCWLQTNANADLCIQDVWSTPVQFVCFLFQFQFVFSCKQTLSCARIRISVGETKVQSSGRKCGWCKDLKRQPKKPID